MQLAFVGFCKWEDYSQINNDLFICKGDFQLNVNLIRRGKRDFNQINKIYSIKWLRVLNQTLV